MIELLGVTRRISGCTILDNVSTGIEKGKILSLLGSSGSGKTSLLRVIAGLDRPDSGEIRIKGRIVSSGSVCVPPFDRNMAMIFQGLALWPHLTVAGNIDFVINRDRYKTRKELSEKRDGLLEMMHLARYAGNYPGQLSGGERQRLAIARALASDPEYLLMDEPFSNLDDLLKTKLLDITRALRDENKLTIVYVTHNIDEALSVSDRIVAVSEGKISMTWEAEEMAGLGREEVLQKAFRTLE